MRTVVALALVVAAGGLFASGCQKQEAGPPPTPPGQLAAQFQIPEGYIGEWRAKLADCGNDKEPVKVIFTKDHLTIRENSGPVQASGASGPHLMVAADLSSGPQGAPEGQSMQKWFGFDISPEHDKLTLEAGDDSVLFVKCPAAGAAPAPTPQKSS